MDSPIRQQQKRNDYQRHKLFRKMARRRKAKKEQEQKAAEKELRRKLRIPKYEDGKPTDTTWMSNWLTKRADKIQENMGDIPSETFDRFNTATAQQQLQNLQGTVQKTVQEVENKAGVGKFNGRTDIKSNPRTITIAADAPAQTVVHEQTHALASPAFGGMEDSLPQHQKISQIYKEDGVHSVAPTTTKDGRVIPPDIRAQLEKYINSPEEIYGRLNELRYGLGLNPTYIVTPEDVQKWRAAGKFDRFWRDVPDSTILRLFNEVAQQAVPIRDDGVYVAKDGKGAYGNMKKLKQPIYADGKPIGYYTLSGERKQPTASDGETVDQTIDLSEFEPVVTMYRDRLPMNANRRFVSDYDEYGFHNPYEVFDPDFVQTPTESRRTNTTNLLHTIDPYGDIPLNAGAFATGLLAGQVAPTVFAQLPKYIYNIKRLYQPISSKSLDAQINYILKNYKGSPLGNKDLNIEQLSYAPQDIAKYLEENPIRLERWPASGDVISDGFPRNPYITGDYNVFNRPSKETVAAYDIDVANHVANNQEAYVDDVFRGMPPLSNFLARTKLTLKDALKSKISTEQFIDELLMRGGADVNGYFDLMKAGIQDASQLVTGNNKLLGPDDVTNLISRMAKGDPEALAIRDKMIEQGGFSAYTPSTNKIHVKHQAAFDNMLGKQMSVADQIAFGHEYGHLLFQKEGTALKIQEKLERELGKPLKELINGGDGQQITNHTGFDPTRIKDEETRKYLIENWFDEIVQRISQWKDALGFRNATQQLTGDDVRKMMKLYTSRTGEDNNISDMISGIVDPDKFAKFFSEFAKNAAIPVTLGGASAISAPQSGYKNGKASGIHIKPENRGKFTALKKRTGHSASWFKKNGTPAQKKMATFALNARKWKHK